MTRSRLSYRVSPDLSRPPVLLLHGFLGRASDWDDIATELTPDFHTIAVDLPGHGESANLPDDCYPIDGCAREIIALLDELALAEVGLVGYSMGGRLALYLAVHYPTRFTRVVLESASPGLRTEDQRKERREQDNERARKLESTSLDAFIREWYAQPLFTSVASRPELLEQLIGMRSTGDPNALAKSLRLMGTGDMPSLWDSLGTLPMPLLCMAGELDPKFAALAREMVVGIPNGHAAIIPDAGHMLHFEQPELYIDRVRSFLSA